MQPVNLGYVGCGFVAQRIHLPNFAALPGCRLLALAEVREQLGLEVGARYGIERIYRSHLDLAADPDIEAVGVSAPFAVQGRIAEDLLRAGKHVFMEKPMAVSVGRAEAMLAASRAGNSRLMVGYMKRYDPGNILLKAHLDSWRVSGECGRLLFARNHGFGGNWTYAQDPNVPYTESPEPAPSGPDDCPEWLHREWRGSYLGYLQQWTHNINLLRFFLQQTPSGTTLKSVDLDRDGMTGLVVLDVDGTRAVVESGYTRYHGWEEHTQIYFEGGWLRTEAPALMHKETSASVEMYRAANGAQFARLQSEYAAPGWSYREEAKQFLECLGSGKAFPSSAEDTLTDVQLYEDIYKAFLASGPIPA